MASKIPQSPLVRGFVKRTYAAAAVENQVLSGNLAVASAPSPVKGLCRVAVAVRAGSRYETPDNLGVSHVLRSACGLSTGEATSFSIVRNLDKLSATLSATSDRETLVYTLSADCDNIEKALKVMKMAIVKQEMRPWELSEVYPRVRYELATRPGAAIALDLIHKAAFRDGLGNSIYAKDHRLKNICSETIQHFINSRFQPSKMAIVGLGVEQPLLSHFAETLKLSGDGGSSSIKSSYRGGEIREEASSPLAYTVIASEGVSLKDKNAFVYGVLRLAIGGGPSVKRGIGSGPLSKAISKSTDATAAKAINVSYSDSGLFGIMIATTPENTKDAISNAMKELNVTDEDVKRAKAQLKAQALYEAEGTDGLITDLANQAVLLGGGKAASSLISEIDSVTTSQVKEALQKFVSGKKSMAAYGNISNVPYLDEI